MQTALISAYRKTEELARFVRALKERGWSILASAGTAKFLKERGIEAGDIADTVGPPILGHRVVTLSREVHAGLLARVEDAGELERLKIPRIDLVFVDLYPLEEEMDRPGATEESILEKTDIGGPALLRSAAKGRRVALSDPSQFATALAYLDSGKEDRQYLASLAAAAEQKAAEYSALSAEASRRFAKN